MDINKEIPIGIQDKELVALIKGLQPQFSRTEAFKIFMERRSELTGQVLRDTLLDQDAPQELRSMAAVILGSDPTQEELLLEGLATVTEPAVQRRIAQSLGKIGSPEALEALRNVRLRAGSRAMLNVNFACSLISYRHGLNLYLINRPTAADILKFDSKKPINLGFESLKATEVNKATSDIKRALPGISISEKVAFSFHCMKQRLWLLLNEEMIGDQAEQRIRDANAVLAVVLKYDHCPERWNVIEYIFSQPNKDNTMDIIGARPSGVTTHFGQVHIVGKEAAINLESVNTVYTLPMVFEAVYNFEKVTLRVIQAISAMQAIERQIKPAVPQPG